MTDNHLPHWDLSNVYPGLDSPEFESAFQDLSELIDALETFIDQNQINRHSVNLENDLSVRGSQISQLIELLSDAYTQVYTLRNYIDSFTSTDSYDTVATRLYSMVQSQVIRIQAAEKLFAGWLGILRKQLDEITKLNPIAEAHAFYLQESAQQSQYLMSDPEEELAIQLSLSGIRAWGKLQKTVTSQLVIEFELDGEQKSYPLPALQNIRRADPDPGVRRRAFTAEIKGLEGVRESLAACLNGVTGSNIVVNERRHREDTLHHALDTARIDRETLEAMLAAMQASFPAFRSYLHQKARRLGKESLAWWDLFAPVSQNNRLYTWPEARDFVIENFETFSPDLASFARHAFDHDWIDAEPRDGKRGGAFCMRIPGVEESRVLCNFDGSLDQVSTIAHELGHAYHIECQRGKDFLQYITPMTLAETASIFCETIILEAALNSTASPSEELAILETILINDTQLIVDISSRFLFEQEVYKRRQEAELSADEFCEILTHAQVETYGNGLDSNHLHPYMWAWKPHYYREDIAFYNFPYAFGLLFSTGLYAIYKQRGQDFVPQLKDLLASTGSADAADLAARFEIDIRTVEFWEDSLEIIRQRIERYKAT
jgi:pepF/M3 family oligoendopeptidase